MRTPKDWDGIFLDIARAVAQRSKDPNTQVGAVLVSQDRRLMSCGYNGFPAGVPETPERWQRPEKYKRVCHAEINAILNARTDLRGWTLYITLPSCSECAKYVSQAGIKRVVYDGQPKPGSELEYGFAVELMREAGITIERYQAP